MMTVEIDTIAPSKDGLMFGLTIRYSPEGPVRFAQAHLPWRSIAKRDRALILHSFNQIRDDALDTEPLF